MYLNVYGSSQENMTLLKFVCLLYQFHHQTFPITKIDGAKSNFESMFQQERNLLHETWHEDIHSISTPHYSSKEATDVTQYFILKSIG